MKERKTVNELAAESGIHPTQISQWKRPLREGLPDLFFSRRGQGAREEQALPGELYQEIGRLKMELEWLKKKATPFDHRKARTDGAGAYRLQPPASV